MMGLRTGMVSIRRNTTALPETGFVPAPAPVTVPVPVPESSSARITGETNRTWNRMIWATNDASPSTWTATGMPRLAELT